MAVVASVVTVTTSATALSSSGPADVLPGSSIAIIPASQIYVGAADVTTGTGFPVAAGATFTVDLGPGEALYAVAASGTVAVQVFQAGVG